MLSLKFLYKRGEVNFMKMQAYTKTIQDILSVNKRYIIPRYQREYSWKTNQLNELWDDIVDNIVLRDGELSTSEYFIGSLVMVGDDKDSKLEIVDGQQRLTTITILLSALVEAFKSAGEHNLAQGVYSYIEARNLMNEPYFRLITKTSEPFFQSAVQHLNKESRTPNNQEESNLLEAYKFFLRKLQMKNLMVHLNEEKELKLSVGDKHQYIICLSAIRDQILALETVYITVANRFEAYTIFETLNAKGMDLSTMDLIKNKIFQCLPANHPSDIAKEGWEEIKGNLRERSSNTNLSTFFRHFWISKYEKTTEARIYRSFNKIIDQTNERMREFLEELKLESNNYKLITKPLESDWPLQEQTEIYLSLKALNNFKISAANSLLLALIAGYKAQQPTVKLKQLKKCVNAIEKFHFIFSAVCSSRASGLEVTYSRLARELRESNSTEQSTFIVEELLSYLRERLPSKHEFIDKWCQLEYTDENEKDKKLIQYVFSKWESHLQDTNELSVLNVTLEHIGSQSTHNEVSLGMMGNLLPLSGGINNRIGNVDYKSKVKAYQKSALKTVEQFVQQYEKEENWTHELILERTNAMAEYAYDRIWKI